MYSLVLFTWQLWFFGNLAADRCGGWLLSFHGKEEMGCKTSLILKTILLAFANTQTLQQGVSNTPEARQQWRTPCSFWWGEKLGYKYSARLWSPVYSFRRKVSYERPVFEPSHGEINPKKNCFVLTWALDLTFIFGKFLTLIAYVWRQISPKQNTTSIN